MSKISQFCTVAAAALAITAGAPQAYAADAADEPMIIEIKSNIFGYQGPENQFTLFLGSTEKDAEFFVAGPKTSEYVYVDPYTLGQDSDGSNAVMATAVHCSVTETDNTIRIYGDASKLDYIDVHGCYLSEINLAGNFVNLSVIDVSHNELTEIDLSPFPSLESIDLLDNMFTVPSKMKIGTNHPNLMILSVGINDVIDPELDLKNFPELLYFSARNNYGVTSIDPSGCPNLVSLVLEVTNIQSIDVSKNLNLDVLNLSNTKVVNVDLSNNVKLGELYINHDGSYNSQYKLTDIDLSKNVNLERLDLGGNALTSIDLSNNPRLIMLFLMRNRLTELDLSAQKRLANVDISRNYLNFATLPLPDPNWMYYYQQNPIRTEFKYKVGDPIDFSSQVIRAPYVDATGNTITPATFAAVFAVPRAGTEYEVSQSAYTYDIDTGVLTFNEAIPDSVYLRFHNTCFDEWDLTTTTFMVKTPEEYDLPSKAFSFTPASSLGGQKIAFKIGGVSMIGEDAFPADVTVIINGESTVLEGALTGSLMPEENNIEITLPLLTSEVTISLPDGLTLSALEMTDILLQSIDLTQAEALRTLRLNNNGLTGIDLGYNNSLVLIDLSNNKFQAINLKGVRGDYEKWNLADLNMANNNLQSIVMTDYSTLRNLDISNNDFSSMDFQYYTGLRYLDISGNRMEGELNLEKVENLVTLLASGNNLYSITCGSWSHIQTLDLTDNSFSFASLPQIGKSGVDYSYAPQKPMRILSAAAAINLSSQNIGGNTTFTWKYADSKETVADGLLTCDGGATQFSEDLVGATLFCEMTNPAFPAFDANPLMTTNVTVADKPTTVVATFTTPQSGTAEIGFRFNTPGDNAVYIDWRGDGSEYEPYIYEGNTDETQSIYRTGTTYAGKTAVVYTFGSPEDISVFAMNNTKLTDLDLSRLTKVRAIDVHKAGLTDGKLTLPDSPNLTELVLDASNFTNESFASHTKLSFINLTENNYSTFDASQYKNATFLILSHNKIENITFGGNTRLYQLDLGGNLLESINLNGLTSLEELILSDNYLTEIDLTPVKSNIHALVLSGNNFTFATLPTVAQVGENLTYYDYFNQRPFTVPCIDGQVDLSEQAEVEGNPTEFRWFLGNKQTDVYYDYYYEMFIGEELEGPSVSDDPEYVIENGVTTFLYAQSRKVIGALTNATLPSLILYTTPISIDVSGVDVVNPDEAFGSIVDVYTIGGVRVRSQVPVEDAIRDLAPGIYIIGGKKVLVK